MWLWMKRSMTNNWGEGGNDDDGGRLTWCLSPGARYPCYTTAVLRFWDPLAGLGKVRCLTQNFRQKTSPHQPFFLPAKLGWMIFHVVYFWQRIISFCYKARVWQTDRRTESDSNSMYNRVRCTLKTILKHLYIVTSLTIQTCHVFTKNWLHFKMMN